MVKLFTWRLSSDIEVVVPETAKDELIRLLREQGKALRDEIFDGFTNDERAAFEARKSRIHILEAEISALRPINRQKEN